MTLHIIHTFIRYEKSTFGIHVVTNINFVNDFVSVQTVLVYIFTFEYRNLFFRNVHVKNLFNILITVISSKTKSHDILDNFLQIMTFKNCQGCYGFYFLTKSQHFIIEY